ncbi:Borealin, partial [Dissostichus eleginoides]
RDNLTVIHKIPRAFTVTRSPEKRSALRSAPTCSPLQRFPKPLSSLGSMDWHQSCPSKAIHLLLFH